MGLDAKFINSENNIKICCDRHSNLYNTVFTKGNDFIDKLFDDVQKIGLPNIEIRKLLKWSLSIDDNYLSVTEKELQDYPDEMIFIYVTESDERYNN
jgi:hypothetical protein